MGFVYPGKTKLTTYVYLHKILAYRKVLQHSLAIFIAVDYVYFLTICLFIMSVIICNTNNNPVPVVGALTATLGAGLAHIGSVSLDSGTNSIGTVALASSTTVSLTSGSSNIGTVALASGSSVSLPVNSSMIGAVIVNNTPSSPVQTNVSSWNGSANSAANPVYVSAGIDPLEVSLVEGAYVVSSSHPLDVTLGSAVVPISVTFPTSQAVTGTVSVDNFPSTVAVTNFPANVSVNNFPSSQLVQTTSGHTTLTTTPSLGMGANGNLANAFAPLTIANTLASSSILTGPSTNGVYRIKGKLTAAVPSGYGFLYVCYYFGESNSIAYYPGGITLVGTATEQGGTNADRSYTPCIMANYAPSLLGVSEFVDDYDFLYNHSSGDPVYMYYTAISTSGGYVYCANTTSFSLLS